MELIKMRVLLIFCLTAAPLVMADMLADCKSSEEHFKKATVYGKRDWTQTDSHHPKIKVNSLPVTGEDSKSYAYCAAALAAGASKNSDGKIYPFNADTFMGPKVTDVETALRNVVNHPIKPNEKLQEHDMKIQKYCSRSFKNELVLFQKVIMYGPACVEVTLPKVYKKDKYDCVADKDSAGEKQKYHALVYGLFNNDFDIQVFKGLNWGKDGHTRLKNAVECGLLDKVSYIGFEGKS